MNSKAGAIEFPVLESETDLTTGLVRRYYVDIRTYNASLTASVEQMTLEELDTLRKQITARKKTLKMAAKKSGQQETITKAVTEKQKAKKEKREKRKKDKV
jgi:hypothetical protein